jgi:hypothetical protein
MRVSLLFLLTILIIFIIIDWYFYRQIKRRVRNRRLWARLQLVSALILDAILIAGMIVPARSGDNPVLLLKMWMLFLFGTVAIPKVIILIFDLLAKLPTLFGKKRCKVLTRVGLAIAGVMFIASWWGALINRFNSQDKEVEVAIADLPQAFDGYRIVQFSDLHSGTYGDDTTYVSQLVDHINSLDADVIVFTGDIVNRETAEVLPFVKILSRLKAPDGVFAILGNHDYGDYMNWDSEADKQANMMQLYQAYDRTGIRLLLNETEWLRRGNDSIALIGVENIGDPPFHVYGSLSKAYPNISDNNTKILLSHNPAHWVDSISGNKDANVHLTLAGHTHAMQIEVCGISPAALRYKTWGGLYSDTDSQHQLYVNIGIGTVGMPMRLGATPEITIFTLRKS